GQARRPLPHRRDRDARSRHSRRSRTLSGACLRRRPLRLMLNIVLPIAGRGSRFSSAGYLPPKPMIPVHGVPMIGVVADNVRPSGPHRFIFLALQEHLDQWPMAETLQQAAPGCTIVPVNTVTQGAACTVLLA